MTINLQTNKTYNYEFENFQTIINPPHIIERTSKIANLKFLHYYIQNPKSNLNINLKEHIKSCMTIPLLIIDSMIKFIPLCSLNKELLKYKISLLLNYNINKKIKQNFIESSTEEVVDDMETFKASLYKFIFSHSPKPRMKASNQHNYLNQQFCWAIYNLSVEGPMRRTAIELRNFLNSKGLYAFTHSDLLHAVKQVITDPLENEFLPETAMSPEMQMQMVNILKQCAEQKTPQTKLINRSLAEETENNNNNNNQEELLDDSKTEQFPSNSKKYFGIARLNSSGEREFINLLSD
jgi:hypothetical protein